MDERAATVGRLAVVLVGAALAAVVGWVLFGLIPATTDLGVLGVLLALAVVLVGVRVAGRLAGSVFATYDVAEVAVEGPISRDGRGPLPTQSGGTPADDIVEQIERADEDDHVRALLLKLNTPGGEVVPSDDIRLAAQRFDGPTLAYTTDLCASGGYWIASGCDALYARDASIVGSIGVIGSRVNATGLADKLGLSYERFAAGKYKDAGTSLKEMEEDERAYLQGIIDDYYENFVERVTEGRDLDADLVRETEARIYLGEDALDLGLVDELGTKEDVTDRLAELLGVEEVRVQAFEPERSLRSRLNLGAQSLAYAFGSGFAGIADDEQGFRFRL